MLTITAYLVQDHLRLHALLAAATAGEHFEEQAFARFREGLLRHIAIEEKILLPAVRAVRGGTPPAGWSELRTEHAALTSLLVPVPDIALCHEIEALLAAHDAKEEGSEGVYAECERALRPDESEVLGRSAADFPSVPVAPHAAHGYRTAASALAAVKRSRRG
jgi:hypothetical protein